jgi:two-component system phosphate regulon sensor histidine kinase PhoR
LSQPVIISILFVFFVAAVSGVVAYVRLRRKYSAHIEKVNRELERSVRRLINEKTSEIDSLKDLERYRKEFLGNVAHELRSPIFNIQGYIYTLIEGAMLDEEVNMKFLQKAARNIDHISSLVEDLVTISMIESGEIHLEFSDFNIKDLVKEVIEFLDLSAKGRNITLSLKDNTEGEPYVHADKQKIKQVLINLIGNSIKYGREQGATTINIRDQHQQVGIEISDNGEGISEEHISRIFERFYRVDKSRSRSQSGTGLGLSIVKHFIEAHKQKIIASSIPDIGSIFSFTLEKSKA